MHVLARVAGVGCRGLNISTSCQKRTIRAGPSGMFTITPESSPRTHHATVTLALVRHWTRPPRCERDPWRRLTSLAVASYLFNLGNRTLQSARGSFDADG